jgi:chromosome segregation ATPase
VSVMPRPKVEELRRQVTSLMTQVTMLTQNLESFKTENQVLRNRLYGAPSAPRKLPSTCVDDYNTVPILDISELENKLASALDTINGMAKIQDHLEESVAEHFEDALEAKIAFRATMKQVQDVMNQNAMLQETKALIQSSSTAAQEAHRATVKDLEHTISVLKSALLKGEGDEG